MGFLRFRVRSLSRLTSLQHFHSVSRIFPADVICSLEARTAAEHSTIIDIYAKHVFVQFTCYRKLKSRGETKKYQWKKFSSRSVETAITKRAKTFHFLCKGFSYFLNKFIIECGLKPTNSIDTLGLNNSTPFGPNNASLPAAVTLD